MNGDQGQAISGRQASRHPPLSHSHHRQPGGPQHATSTSRAITKPGLDQPCCRSACHIGSEAHDLLSPHHEKRAQERQHAPNKHDATCAEQGSILSPFCSPFAPETDNGRARGSARRYTSFLTVHAKKTQPSWSLALCGCWRGQRRAFGRANQGHVPCACGRAPPRGQARRAAACSREEQKVAHGGAEGGTAIGARRARRARGTRGGKSGVGAPAGQGSRRRPRARREGSAGGGEEYLARGRPPREPNTSGARARLARALRYCRRLAGTPRRRGSRLGRARRRSGRRAGRARRLAGRRYAGRR
jgi:hypothetical protein